VNPEELGNLLFIDLILSQPRFSFGVPLCPFVAISALKSEQICRGRREPS